MFDACVAALDAPFKDACREAWESDPVTEPAQMNLNGFGMGNQQCVVGSMHRALVYRFGWRRLVPNRKLKKLLEKMGCPVVGSDEPERRTRLGERAGAEGTTTT